MFKRLRSLFRVLKGRREFEVGMSEELRFHIEQYTDDLMKSGMLREAAAHCARIEFGSLSVVEEECHQARGLHLFDELLRDLSYAARLLRKTPGFTATALLTLAICLGANLTIFAVIDSVLLKPPPFPEPDRLVTVFNTYPRAGVDRDGASVANYYERRGQIAAFAGVSIYHPGTAIVGESGSTEREPVMQVSPDFFETLGRGPMPGRNFTEAETTFETDKVVILTDAYWRQRCNADPRVIGKQIRVDSVPNTVIGVLPPGFRFRSSEARLYFPFASGAEDRTHSQRHSGGNVRQMIARLKPGATVAQAQAQIDAQNGALEAYNPEARMMAEAGFRSIVTPLHSDHVAAIRPTLLSLQAGALALLLIGVVNLANLLLIRASSRVKELAVRQALGASLWHIVSEVVVETTLLTLTGGLLGLAVGAGGIRLLDVLGTEYLPLGGHIALDARLALITLAAAIFMGIVLAAPIAWFNLRRHPGDGLQSESRTGTSGRAAQLLRHGFVVSQTALAFLLLAGAGLLGLSLKRAAEVSPGFRADHILSGQIVLPWKHYQDGTARLAFIEELTNQLSHPPGVLSVGVVSNLPLSGRSGKSAATVKGRIPKPGESPRGHYSYSVGGDYFGAMGFSLRAGRFLTEADSHRAGRVCVVDQDFAHYYWPGGNAVGQRLFEGAEERSDAEAFTVVGVVGSVKQAGLTEETAQGALYYPYAFRDDSNLSVVARTSLPPEFLGLTLQKVVRRIDPDLPVTDVRTMQARIADSMIARRTPALLAGLFSAIALLLTTVGSYGVLSYAVVQRRREIGVRLALGARPGQIRGQFFYLAARLFAYGTALGILGAWLAGRAMQAVLFHVPPLDFEILAGTAGVMAVVSLVAFLVPSYRAAQVSPMEVLAGE